MRARGRADGLEGGGLDLRTRRDDEGAMKGKSKAKSAAVAPLALLALLALLLVLHFARSSGGAAPPRAIVRPSRGKTTAPPPLTGPGTRFKNFDVRI